MTPIVLTEVLAVGEFPTPDQIAILAKAGFKSIINSQPDGEVARFATSEEVAASARRHGLAHVYAPLSSRVPAFSELAVYAEALATLPAPIYAFCYSGARTAAACALVQTAREDAESIQRRFAEAGFDLSALRPWLDEARLRHVGEISLAPPPAAAPSPGHDIAVHPRVAGYGGQAR